MDKCKECRFWELKNTKAPQDGVIQGVCHCNPPIATGQFMPKVRMISGEVYPELIEITIWPITTGIGWCGKFEPKVKPLTLDAKSFDEPILKTPQQLDAHYHKKRMAKKDE